MDAHTLKQGSCKDAEVKLLFVGSPLLDISSKCDKDTLKKFGLKQDDGIKANENHEILFQKLFNDPCTELSSGGSAQNSARAAKWISADKCQVSFLGCTGSDEYEDWLRQKLMSDGVNPLYVNNPILNTGTCACLIVGSERSMITRHDAAETLDVHHLTLKPIEKHILEADYIYVEGYFIGHSPEVVLTLASKCSSNQIFCLSLSAEYICKKHASNLLKVLPRVDVLFGNDVEVKAFATALGAPDTITVEKALHIIRQVKRLEDRPSRIVIVTSGAKPVTVDEGSHQFKTFPIPNNVSVEDSVGCGDALAGGFLSSFSLSKDLDISMEIGIRIATEIAQVKGCDLPSIKISELQAVLKELIKQKNNLK